jgi:mono/diheme cytochrome c family protein
VLVKNFYLNGKIVETRLLMNRLQTGLNIGRWDGFTYEWDEAESHATRVVGGKTTTIEGQSWTYPSEAQCSACHTDAAGDALGPETAQLNGLYHYPNTSGPANQLAELDRIGMFTSPLGHPGVLPRLADPMDESEDIGDRARAYLHSNCAQCHQPGTGIPSAMDLRYSTLLSNTNICDVVPERGNLELGSEARLIAPGDPDNSIILNRMGRRDFAGMPPMGSDLLDDDGLAMMEDWIESLESCLR